MRVSQVLLDSQLCVSVFIIIKQLLTQRVSHSICYLQVEVSSGCKVIL